MIPKILIVEDELIAAYSLAEDIEASGYLVTDIVKTGEAALKAVQSNPPNLILMDIKLQGEMTGIEAADQLKSENIPIIYLTAFNDENTIELASDTNVYGYLNKPAKVEDIQTTIAIALKKHQRDCDLKNLLKKEQQLNQLKTQFLSNVAHDLRIPLTTMLGSLELIQLYHTNLSAAKQEKHLGRMKEAILGMTQQLEDILTVNRSEMGQLPFRPVAVDLPAFCYLMIDSLQDLEMQKSRIKLSINGDLKALKAVPSDETLLKSILVNLLSNAIKYSPPEMPVELCLETTETHVIIEVRDRGIGIPSDSLHHLGQPFQRGQNVGYRPGLGVGLYVVKQAIERHQGILEVSSEEGRGSTFTVKLPR